MNHAATNIDKTENGVTRPAENRAEPAAQRLSKATEPAAVASFPTRHSEQNPRDKAPPPQVVATRATSLARGRDIYLALFLLIFMAALFFVGRATWEEGDYSAEEGIGYTLGLVGGVMMLLAYFYSSFKNYLTRRGKSGLKFWLRFHILLGVIGPFLVVIHSTFRFGSLNSSVALTAMFLVFVSGVIGRYFYSKIHYGVGGAKAKFSELEQSLNRDSQIPPHAHLESFKVRHLTHSGLIPTLWRATFYGLASRRVAARVLRDHKRQLTAQDTKPDPRALRGELKELRANLKRYLKMLKKVAFLSLYERIFAAWRQAHIPLLYILLVSGIVHVIAVHMY